MFSLNFSTMLSLSHSEKFYAEFSNDASLIPNKVSFDEIVNFLRGVQDESKPPRGPTTYNWKAR
jgi:hypothetical protein